jgi:PadR family transcriptional regulator PadR
MKNEEYKLIRSVLPTLILEEIEKKPIHGYEIILTFRKQYHTYFSASTIYPILEQLEKNGLVSSEWNITGVKPRKTYSITEKGKNHKTKNLTFISTFLLLQKV